VLISYTNSQTSVILRVKIRQSTTGASPGQGLTALTFSSSGLIISTIADTESSPTVYTQAGSTIEAVTTLGTYAAPTATKCRFKLVSDSNNPGIYEIQLADARFAVSNAKSLLISITGVTNMADCDVVVPLLATNPYDAVHGGMSALPNVAIGATGTATNGALVKWGDVLPSAPAANTLDEALFVADNLVGRINTAQAGASTTITLDAGASSTDGRYVGYTVYLYGGTGGGIRGVGQERTIVSYVGSTKVATVAQAWGTNPDATSKFMLYSQPFANVGIWNGVVVPTPNVGGVPKVDVVDWLGSAPNALVSGRVDAVPNTRSNTATAGTSTTLTLDAGASAVDNYYTGSGLTWNSGANAGVVRIITGYVGATKVATFAVALPSAADATPTFTVTAIRHLLPGADGKALVSTDTQDLSASFSVNTKNIAGQAATLDSNNALNVSTKYLAGTALTGRDIGASVLLSAGTGTGQLDFTAGVVKANATQWVGGTIPAVNVTGVPLMDLKYTLGTISPATAGYVAIDWGQVTNKTTANALTETTIATSQVVASVSGAVGSVTGAVGSVSGAVGSVTGNVGGNVVGSVGSVTAAVTLSAGDSPVIQTGTAGAGGASTITIATAVGTTADLVGCRVKITSGTGANQERVITGYANSTKVVTVDYAWVTQPDNTSVYAILFDNAPVLSSSLAVTFANTSIASVTTVTMTTNLTNLPSIPANWITAAGIASGALVAAVWDGAISGHTTTGTFGGALNAAGSAGDPWATVIPGAYSAGTAGHIVGTALPDIAPGSANGLLRGGSNTATTFASGSHFIGTVDTVTTYTGNTPQTGDAFARLGAPAGASVSADVAAVKSSVGAPQQVGTKYAVTLLSTDVTGNVAADLQTIKTQAVICAAGVTFLASVGTATTDTAQSGDSFARIGATGSGLTSLAQASAWTGTLATNLGTLAGHDPGAVLASHADTQAAALASTGLNAVLIAGKTLPNAIKYIGAAVAGPCSGAGTGTENYSDFASATAFVATIDTNGNRTGMVYS
jgi:hypothetical protein